MHASYFWAMAGSLEISLKDFARTGEFGPVCLGMTQEAVFYWLGKPDHTRMDADHYGSFEFQYQAGQLFSIANSSLHPAFGHFENHLFANPSFSIDPWFLMPHVMRLGAIIEFLNAESMPFTLHRDGPRPILEFPSGVQLRFDVHEHHGRIGGKDHAELYYIGKETAQHSF